MTGASAESEAVGRSVSPDTDRVTADHGFEKVRKAYFLPECLRANTHSQNHELSRRLVLSRWAAALALA
jgi:hypothetical protein